MANNDMKYVLRWSEEIDDKFLEDFLCVVNVVFGGFTKQMLQRKYIDNIYGSSLVTIAYLDGKPVGVDAMMRNDVLGHVGFETIDTGVTEECRGKGVFSTITQKEVAEINTKYPNALIYGFPNDNSFPGYVKMGWNVQCMLYPAPFLFPRLYDKENPTIIDVKYAKWLCESTSKFYYIKKRGQYYLIKQGQRHYQMVGRIEPDAALFFERKEHPGLIRCRSVKKRFFNSDDYQGSIITLGKLPVDIPYWKTDLLLN